MKQLDRFKNIILTYSQYGWQLRRIVMRPETRAALDGAELDALGSAVTVQESALDALWFARPSLDGREAWELRLVADTPYALFEMFEADEEEEDREDVRREMEARMRDYAEKQRSGQARVGGMDLDS
ncbi:MAG TPA: hypothetical protein VGB17_08290 [Pyrinomonadaceae bacterium]|jgi:hypothetical protein